MKYQIGDRVKIKSFDWFRNGACIGFSTLMSKYCGAVLTIQSKNNTNDYFMKEDGGQFYWTDDMIEGMVNISKLGTAANPIEPKSNANCLTQERVDQLATKIDKELPSGNQYVWELPDGYQFVDEDGNVINAKKIVLEKKDNGYPNTYEECCKVLGKYADVTYGYKKYELHTLQMLLVCRDAYWQIAGQEMGLDEPWEPDYSGTFENGTPIKYVIYNIGTHIVKERKSSPNHILSFPTEEMGNAFYENFKKEIEICKEFL